MDHNNWWGLLTGACKTLEKYVTKNHPMGLIFNMKGEDKWDQLISGGQSTQSTKPVTEQKPSVEQKTKRTFS